MRKLRKIVVVNKKGKILSTIKTNDPTLQTAKGYRKVDITDVPEADEILKRKHLYTFQEDDGEYSFIKSPVDPLEESTL